MSDDEIEKAIKELENEETPDALATAQQDRNKEELKEKDDQNKEDEDFEKLSQEEFREKYPEKNHPKHYGFGYNEDGESRAMEETWP